MGRMSELAVLLLALAVLVMLDFVRFGSGSGVYPSTKSGRDRMSGGQW